MLSDIAGIMQHGFAHDPTWAGPTEPSDAHLGRASRLGSSGQLELLLRLAHEATRHEPAEEAAAAAARREETTRELLTAQVSQQLRSLGGIANHLTVEAK